MTIDLHSHDTRGTYASPTADRDWSRVMSSIVDPRGRPSRMPGAGDIYNRAWNDPGAARVIGTDFSAQMIADATAVSGSYPALAFSQKDATGAGLQTHRPTLSSSGH